MKKLIALLMLCVLISYGYSQVDTISKNIYQLNGKIGIGRVNYSNYINLFVYDGWLKVADSTDHDAGIVVSHLHKTGYGFARTLHMVNEGVNGDPYTEFRILNTDNTSTVTSWSIGALNSDQDKLIISNSTYVSTGASPSYGNKIVAITTSGEFGIGTTDPKSKLEVADGDIYISDIEKGVIMKSPDGQCWRGTLSNSGILNFVQIDCPETQMNGMQSLKSKESILIYPNPSGNSIMVNSKNNTFGNVSYSIYDLTGKMAGTGILKSPSETIDISAYKNGTYILNIKDKNGNLIASEKLIKQK